MPENEYLAELRKLLPQREETVVKSLERFTRLVQEANKHVNLTAVTSDEDFAVKHIADSLSAERFVPRGAKTADIGSGGGFPAIPLAIAREDIFVTLVESIGKKCAFLQGATAELGLKNTEVLCARAEIMAKDARYRERYDVVTARAVAGLNALCEYCLPLVKVGGVFIAYKGANAQEEIDGALTAIKLLGGKIEQTVLFSLEGNSRALIIIRKEKHTSPLYPREAKYIKSKPL